MPAPLTFAVEFATAQAERALSSLVNTVKASTVDIAANVLAPISPANLVTQIAQQGLGVNALAGNLVAGGIGALSGSKYGYLTQMGAQFNAENAAINQTIAEARASRAAGMPMSDEAMDFAYRLNYQQAQAQENEELRFKRRIGQQVASNDASKALDNGSRLWNDLSNEPAVQRESMRARHYAGVAADVFKAFQIPMDFGWVFGGR